MAAKSMSTMSGHGDGMDADNVPTTNPNTTVIT
jgi:hypothetical protein